MDAGDLVRRAAGVGAGVVVAAGDVGRRSVGHEVEHPQVRGHRARLECPDVLTVRPHAGVDRHHRPVARRGQDDGGRRTAAAAFAGGDPLGAQHVGDEVAGEILGQRRRHPHPQAEPGRADRGDRAAAGRPQQVAGVPLVAQCGHALQADDRQVEEGRSCNCQVEAHGGMSIPSASAHLR